jgi:hypothetical protein
MACDIGQYGTRRETVSTAAIDVQVVGHNYEYFMMTARSAEGRRSIFFTCSR